MPGIGRTVDLGRGLGLSRAGAAYEGDVRFLMEASKCDQYASCWGGDEADADRYGGGGRKTVA